MKPYGKEWEEWVTGLSVGDKVAVRSSYYSTVSYRIATIEKITKTGQIKVSGSDKRSHYKRYYTEDEYESIKNQRVNKSWTESK